MKKIILATITATLLFANTAEETPVATKVTQIQEETKTVIAQAETKVKEIVKATKANTGATLAQKQSKREEMLEAELVKKEALRVEKTKLREAKLKKLDTDLQAKADKRAGIIY